MPVAQRLCAVTDKVRGSASCPNQSGPPQSPRQVTPAEWSDEIVFEGIFDQKNDPEKKRQPA